MNDILGEVRDGDVETIADILETVMQRMGRMSDRDIDVIGSILRSRDNLREADIDALTDVAFMLA